MSNKEIRSKILNHLYEVYEDDPFYYTSCEKLKLGIRAEEKEIKSNIMYLEQSKLIDVYWVLGGSFMAKINSNGINQIEESQKQGGQKNASVILNVDGDISGKVAIGENIIQDMDDFNNLKNIVMERKELENNKKSEIILKIEELEKLKSKIDMPKLEELRKYFEKYSWIIPYISNLIRNHFNF